MKNKRTVLAATIAIALLATTGCAPGAQGDNGIRVWTSWIDTPDGGQVLCARAFDGGVTCDWDHQRTKR